MKVEVVGLNKVDVLLALYTNAKCGGAAFAGQPMMKMMGHIALAHQGELDKAQAAVEEASKNGDYFDYIDLGAGPRPLKVSLAGFDFDPTQYDHYNDSEGYLHELWII